MSRTRYEYKHINKNNAYVATKILSWTMKVLEEGNDVTNNDMYINLLLNHLPSKSIQDLLNEYIKFKIKILENKITGFGYVLRNTTVDRLKEDLEYEAGTVRVNGQDLEELLGLLGSNWKESLLKEIKESIITKVNNLIDENRSKALDDKMITTIKKLQDVFRLSDAEINCVILYYAMDVDSNFDILLYRSGNIQDKSDRIKLLFDITHSEANKIFFNNSPLWKYKIINENERINTYIIDYLAGFQETPLSSIFYKEYNGESLSLKNHSIRKKDNEILKELIKRKEKNKGVNILLYGTPGSGKTEYTRSLSRHLKMNLFEVNSEVIENNRRNIRDNRDSSEMSRYAALIACQNTIPQKKSMILIDEADEMLNGNNQGGFLALFGGGSARNTEKNKINELLDNSVTVNFWITNHFSSIDDSTLRRFDYSIEFEKFDFKQRLTVWKTVLKKYELTTEFPKNEIKKYAEQYEFNAGGIDVVLKNFKRMPKKNRNKETLKSLIEPHLKLMNMNSDEDNNGNKHLKPVKNYSLKGLNIKGEHSISDGLEIITEFSNFMKTEEYKDTEMKNMNLLLHGPSGTGKTEFVKYLAKKTGRELLFKSGSDFLGMYVGQTEQNIKNAFKEAEKKSAILFIDEADGLLFDRSKSSRSFEMTQVNEMLVQMENFNGILICSSNFQKNMDSAIYRRFNLKFEFDYLTKEGNFIFYKTILGALISLKLSNIEKNYISSIKGLTPGDFKVVKQKYSFFNKKKITHNYLIKALEEEVGYKDIGVVKKFGFGR